ncbi:hypothetical protein EDB81DRAFT_762249 [Dactylonectria macrodidyma]|uniref:Uncharacterized protein n=1 Tax=Dactylonectria macrodidyma TaxID=307937 RepID=A0A9P9J022_9HYPO|nr:hypothetical protein EDB81DRAFT_762249 [Dactylonectria macrodidyma]
MASTAPSDAAIISSSPPPPPGQSSVADVAPQVTPTPSSTATTTTSLGPSQSRDTSDGTGRALATALSTFPVVKTQLEGGFHDGRVGDPIPSKLKGKINGRSGNFGVWLMGSLRSEKAERDSAAKRSSEGTAAAAELANKEGYRPIKPTQLAWYPPEQAATPASVAETSAALPFPAPEPFSIPDRIPVSRATSTKETEAAAQPEGETTPAEASPPAQTLTPQGTKVEQARLLTLLRSLHPLLVVDQICKALAYFGGIPGAPVPADGVFPESAAANGPGSLFVGWVAEIFPELDAAGNRTKRLPPTPIPGIGSAGASSSVGGLSIPVRRSRGRPKGSKSTKPRKDKGIRKSGIANSDPSVVILPEPALTGPALDSEQNATHPPPVNSLTNTSQSNQDGANTADHNSQASVIAHAALKERYPANWATTPHNRRRGRPKGSKNKPKPVPKPAADHSTADSTQSEALSQSQNAVANSPLAHKTAANRRRQPDSAIEGSTENMPNATSVDSVQQDTLGQAILGNEQATSLGTNSNPTQEPQSPQPGNQNDGFKPSAPSRKRKKPTQAKNSATSTADDVPQPADPVAEQTSSSQALRTKRRQVSKGSSRKAHEGSFESQNGTETTASPTLPVTGQPMSALSSFSSQPQLQNAGANLGQMAHNQQQQSPNIAPQRSSQSQGASPALDRQQNQFIGAQGRTQADMAAQSFYEQQQIANRYRQNSNTGERFARSISASQFQQSMMNQAVGLGNQSRQQPSQTVGSSNPMGSFQGYGDPNYIGIDYSTDTTDAGAVAAFGGHAQIDGVLTEPNMPERMYHHAVGR